MIDAVVIVVVPDVCVNVLVSVVEVNVTVLVSVVLVKDVSEVVVFVVVSEDTVDEVNEKELLTVDVDVSLVVDSVLVVLSDVDVRVVVVE